MDITSTLAPRSDQLNADDLVAAPVTVTVAEVRVPGGDQPVEVVTHEYGPGRPYKPCKSMRRVLARVWGADSSTWAGGRMTLYCDPGVTFGKDKVGGIRISHITGIDKAESMLLTTTRSKRAAFTVQPLPDAPAPQPEPTAEEIAACTDRAVLRDMWGRASDRTKALIQARVGELDQAPTDAPTEEPPAGEE